MIVKVRYWDDYLGTQIKEREATTAEEELLKDYDNKFLDFFTYVHGVPSREDSRAWQGEKTIEQCVSYNKLVRDKVLEKIDGKAVAITLRTKATKVTALLNKLKEEAAEVADAVATHPVGKVAEEIADMYEVLDALLSTLAIDKDFVLRIQKEKRQELGAFDKGLFLQYITHSWNDPTQ